MRAFIVAIALFLSCAGRTALSDRVSDSKPRLAPTDAAATADTTPQADADVGAVDVSSDRAAEGSATDLKTAADGNADLGLPPGCSPLQISWLPEPLTASCPPSAETTACASHDQGATVARSGDCVASWSMVPYQCIGWPAFDPTREFVVLTAPACSDLVVIDQVLLCQDHIEIHWSSQGVCDICDTAKSLWRLFTLPLDSRPVIATETYGPHPPCTLK